MGGGSSSDGGGCPPNAGAQYDAFVNNPGIPVQGPGQYSQSQFTGQTTAGMSDAHTTPKQPHHDGWSDKIGRFLGFGGDNVQTISTRIYNQIAANVVANVLLQCSVQAGLAQQVSIQCAQDPDFIDNAGCVACTKMWHDIMANRAKLESHALDLDPGYTHNIGSQGIPGTLSGNALALYVNQTFQPCNFACKQCDVFDIKQTQAINVDFGCADQMDLATLVSNNFEAEVSAYLTNQKDFLGEMGGFLAGGSRECIARDIAHRMSAKFTTEIANKLRTKMNTIQSIEIGDRTDPSSSVWATHFKQQLTANSIASLIAHEKIFDGLYSSTEVKAAANLLSKNDTVGDLARDIEELEVGLDQVLGSIVGKALLVIGVLLVGLIIIFMGIMIFDKDARAQWFHGHGREEGGTVIHQVG